MRYWVFGGMSLTWTHRIVKTRFTWRFFYIFTWKNERKRESDDVDLASIFTNNLWSSSDGGSMFDEASGLSCVFDLSLLSVIPSYSICRRAASTTTQMNFIDCFLTNNLQWRFHFRCRSLRSSSSSSSFLVYVSVYININCLDLLMPFSKVKPSWTWSPVYGSYIFLPDGCNSYDNEWLKRAWLACNYDCFVLL